MSDHSHSAGSSGSSSNSWTLLSPEEAGVENVGQVDDGTESLGDAPSLSEDLAGAEFKPVDVPVETVLSEEGQQVCQETSPDGPPPSSPPHRSPLLCTPDLPEPPIIHDIVTSSPSDMEPLGATSFVTHVDFDPAAEPEERSASAESDQPEHLTEAAEVISDVTAEADMKTVAEATTDSPAHTQADVSTDEVQPPSVPEHPGGPESKSVESAEIEQVVEDKTAEEEEEEEEIAVETVEEETGVEEVIEETTVGEAAEGSTVGAMVREDDVEEIGVEEATETFPEEPEDQQGEELQESAGLDHSSSFDDGLRRRNLPPFDGPRPRTSDEEDEEEELEFKLAEKTPEKPWFSVNKCIVGALVLLFLGSLFLSGDFDAAELSDGEQSQDILSRDPQDMKELLAKLTQENQHISVLEAQLQAQKAELDSALTALAASGDEEGRAHLETENQRLKDELTSLPDLKNELESLRARVTELSQLTVAPDVAPVMSDSAPQSGDGKDGLHVSFSPERKEEANVGDEMKLELQRQKNLLEQSKKRLQGMKKHGGDRKRVRENLEEIHRKLSEHVERWGKKKSQETKCKGSGEEHNGRWKKEEKKERRGEKERKPSKEGEWKENDRKSQKQNSHKESWRKHQDEWERKKGERRMDREERRKEKLWHGRAGKKTQKQQQPRKPDHQDFWTHQELKLRRSIRPQVGCSSVEDCAAREGLYPVELPEFEELLEGYLSKLDGSSVQSKDEIRKLTAEFFEDGVFIHDRILFSDFAEDVADVLEDVVDTLGDDDSLEEEMEEFEREALWKFAATS